MKRVIVSCVACAILLASCASKKGQTINNAQTNSDVAFWMTKGDRSVLLQKQDVALNFGTAANTHKTITVDENQTYQSIDGFGYTLTGGSATLINQLPEKEKDALLKELFSTEGNAIGVSYLRVSIGASDLSAKVFTYNELPAGETDVNMERFSIAEEMTDLVPVLKKILTINPSIKILGSPWTPPTWMKTNKAYKGGSLLPEFYQAYAKYFVKYIQQMKAEGITIDAVTPQNEPLHPGNNPSLLMLAAQQNEFIKNHLRKFLLHPFAIFIDVPILQRGRLARCNSSYGQWCLCCE